MRRLQTNWILLLLGAMTFAVSAPAAQLFMVSNLVGNVTARADSGEDVEVAKARWAPTGVHVYTRNRSGVELLSPGVFLRFGDNTVFSFGAAAIQLHKGALLARLHGSGKQWTVEGPEASLRIAGKGSFMMEVLTNGGFKAIGLSGKPSLSLSTDGQTRSIHPGEVLFVKPLGRGWGDPVHVNLTSLVPVSFLLRGFPNPKSYEDEVDRSARTQSKLITKTFRAEVGDARQPDSFEIRVNPAEPTETEEATATAVAEAVDAPPPADPDPDGLPVVPGPPIQFPSAEPPNPSVKDIFDAPLPELNPEPDPDPEPEPKGKFPGKIFDL